jgi:cell division protein FtsL
MRKQILLFTIGIALVGIVIHILRTSYKTFESSQRVDQLATEIEAIETENYTLRQELKERETTLFIEKIARNKLNLVLPGEKLVVVEAEEVILAEEQLLIQQLERKTPLQQWQILILGTMQ